MCPQEPGVTLGLSFHICNMGKQEDQALPGVERTRGAESVFRWGRCSAQQPEAVAGMRTTCYLVQRTGGNSGISLGWIKLTKGSAALSGVMAPAEGPALSPKLSPSQGPPGSAFSRAVQQGHELEALGPSALVPWEYWHNGPFSLCGQVLLPRACPDGHILLWPGTLAAAVP